MWELILGIVIVYALARRLWLKWWLRRMVEREGMKE
jgi:hypothetical protein